MPHIPPADPWAWFARRTFHHARFADLDALVRAKEERGLTVSVCLPTRNEAETVGAIVRVIREDLMERVALVDEVVVIDSASADGTQEAAVEAGASVHEDSDILPDLPSLGGKGDAMWKSLFVLKGDLIVFIDADIREFGRRFVTGLLGPLLLEEDVQYVKAFYERPLQNGSGLAPSGGGRVTELVARPILNLFFPELATIIQPLSGEYAGRRELFESVPFLSGYGVELGLLIDVATVAGLEGVAQVDLEMRIHRNHPMPDLSRMAFGVMQAAFRRLHSTGRIELHREMSTLLHQFRPLAEGYGAEEVAIAVRERPPAATEPRYRESHRPAPRGS